MQASGSSESNFFWCVHCLRKYHTKQRFLQHFDRPFVQENCDNELQTRGGKTVKNPCHGQTKSQLFGKTKHEAILVKKQSESSSLFQFFKKSVGILGSSEGVNVNECDESSSSTAFENESTISSSQVFRNPTANESNDQDGMKQFVERNRIESNDSMSIISSPSVVTSIGSSASVDILNDKMDEVSATSKKILELLQSLDLNKSTDNSKSNRQKTLEEHLFQSKTRRDDLDLDVNSCVDLLKNAKSMESVMRNKLINGIFVFATKNKHGHLIPVEELDGTDLDFIEDDFYLLCQLCSDQNIPCSKGIHVENKSYIIDGNQDEWFSTVKKGLVKHICNKGHTDKSDKFDKKIRELYEEIDNIKRNIRYLIYYLLRSNTAFIRFPELLAVAHQCGIQIGNINHAKCFPAKILPLVDGVLLENTGEWLKNESIVTLLLDHGTVFGLVMLVVYFVGYDGSVRLSGCQLTSSKEGAETARSCYQICLSNPFISENTLKSRIKVVCADGAIVDRNDPFKREMKALFDNNDLVFRWDILHMANRAHIAARGSTDVDTQTDDGSNMQRNRTLLVKTMNYVQTESKRLRTGIHYTGLVLSTIDFMRPKVFSSTRMSLYEYEQVHRFLQVKHYFDVPWQYETLCQLYVFILLAIKIMFKTCQKTTDQRHYIKRVFLGAHGNEPEGKTAMQLCLRIAKDVLRGNDISYLQQNPQVDIVANNPLDNQFVQGILDLWTTLGDKLVATHLVNPNPITREEVGITVDVIEQELERFINQFWVEFSNRHARTDADNEISGCYSEAPCETFFSLFDRITHFRQSLKFENVIILTRILTEGPDIGTESSHDLIKKAMENYRTISHLGERYTTVAWGPAVISKTVRKIMNRTWAFQIFSNF